MFKLTFHWQSNTIEGDYTETHRSATYLQFKAEELARFLSSPGSVVDYQIWVGNSLLFSLCEVAQ